MRRPSFKIILSIIIAIILTGGVLLYSYIEKKKSAPKNELADLTAKSLVQLSLENSADTDGDGLKDWEETLWRTDPKNPDTDGDSTRDGEEVFVKRDPAKAGPNDVLVTPSVNTGSSATSTDDELSGTSKFAREFFGNYLSLKQQGVEITPDVEQRLLEQTLGKNFAEVAYKTYTASDLKVSSDSGAEALKIYGNNIARKVNVFSSNVPVGEFSIFLQGVYTQDEKELEKLDDIIKWYFWVKDELLKITVPEKATSAHIRLLNSISFVTEIIKNMRLVLTDPITSLEYTKHYLDAANEIDASFMNLGEIFTESGVIFNENDEGKMFVGSQ